MGFKQGGGSKIKIHNLSTTINKNDNTAER
jgi:hypothetical protein